MQLPEEDEAYLNEKEYQWQLVPDGNNAYLVIAGFAVSTKKYNRSSVDLMIRIPTSYPNAALDMFYVEPHIELKGGGKPQAADQIEQHMGRSWQRFSRHFGEKWRAGTDNIASFLALIRNEVSTPKQ